MTQVKSAGNLFDLLTPYRHQIEIAIKDAVHSFGKSTPLKKACEYALLNGGKRFRPSLVLMIAESIGKNCDVMPCALGVEFFHTASLIADDLPCMDDDDMRRECPTVHKVYGEATALLASYTLIAAGYEQLAINARRLMNHQTVLNPERICLLALENATYNTGLFGATGGQFEDLYPESLTLPLLKEIIQKKTVSLFEISFVFGWLFGGGQIEELEQIKKAACHFGMSFQIADDLEDMAQDIKNDRKVNMALAIGPENALKMFHQEIASFETILSELSSELLPLKHLADKLKASIGWKFFIQPS